MCIPFPAGRIDYLASPDGRAASKTGTAEAAETEQKGSRLELFRIPWHLGLRLPWARLLPFALLHCWRSVASSVLTDSTRFLAIKILNLFAGGLCCAVAAYMEEMPSRQQPLPSVAKGASKVQDKWQQGDDIKLLKDQVRTFRFVAALRPFIGRGCGSCSVRPVWLLVAVHVSCFTRLLCHSRHGSAMQDDARG